jgi:hypothetical protein
VGTILVAASLLALAGGPRLDGVYQCRRGATTTHLRFFADGTAVEVATTPDSTLAVVKELLEPAREGATKGKWTLATDGKRLSLHLIIPREPGVSPAIALDYAGVLDEKSLALRWASHHEKTSLDRRGHCTFRFAPWPLAAWEPIDPGFAGCAGG